MASATIHRNDKPELGRLIAALVRERHGTDTVLGPFVGAFEEASTRLATALAPLSTATAAAIAATGAAKALDEERDAACRGLYYLLLGYATQRHDPALAAAARAALPVLFPSRLEVVHLPLGQQSAALEATSRAAAGAELSARLATMPGVPGFVTALAAAQERFATAVGVKPAHKAAVSDAIDALREADDTFDGVVQGYVGAVKRRFPGEGKVSRSERAILLAPLTAARATQKAKATRRRKPAAAPA